MQTIIRMVNHTRLDCLIGSASGMRVGTVQAIHHARHRSALRRHAGRPAGHAERAGRPGAGVRGRHRHRLPHRRAPTTRTTPPFRRVATAVSKYWVCKRAPLHAVEALECLGGNGYVEESGMPRLLRDSPLNSIWEGSGNVAALDVLRALAREPDGHARVPGRGRAGGRRRRPPGRPRGRAQAAPGRPGRAGPPVRRPPRGRGHGPGAAGLAAGAPRARAGGRRVLRLAPGPRGRPRLGHAARRARDAKAIVDRALRG